jgi:LacI family transcriptional regulator
LTLDCKWCKVVGSIVGTSRRQDDAGDAEDEANQTMATMPTADAAVRRSRLPAYQRVVRIMRDRIADYGYAVGEYFPSERDLAAEFRCSRDTIRQAVEVLKQDGLVASEQGRGTVVLGLPEPHMTPREARDQLQLAALIVYGMARDGSAAIFQGCQEIMRYEDHHLIVCETPRDALRRHETEAAHLRSLIDKGIGGIIIYAEPTDRNRSLLAEAVACGVNVVQIDRYLQGLDCDYVGVPNAQAAREAVEHLVQDGYRRIVAISLEPEPSSCTERLAGYTDAMDAHELPARVEMGGTTAGTNAEMARIVDGWIVAEAIPDAVFAVNDGLALLLIRALRDRGLRVPNDVAVAGFDDIGAAALMEPLLTTVRQPFYEMGQTAARLLLDRMAGTYTGVARRVTCPTQLVVRESCGCSPPGRAKARSRAARL